MNALNNEQDDSMDEFFRDRFSDFESDAGDFLWSRIEPELPVAPVRRFVYWQVAAAAILALLIGTYFLSSDSITTTIFSSKISESTTIATVPVNKPSNQVGKSISAPHIAKKLIATQKESAFKDDFHAKNLTYHPGSLGVAAKKTKDNQHQKSTNQQVIHNERAYDKIVTENKQQIIDNTSTSLEENGSLSQELNTNTNATAIERSLTSLQSKPYQLLVSHFAKTKIRFKGPKPAIYYKVKHPAELYVSAMPLVNYYTITPNETDDNYVHGVTVNDGGRVGIYAQGGLRFTLSEKIKLRTGLSFSSSSQLISYQVRTDSIISQSSDQTTNVSFVDVSKEYKLKANYVGAKADMQYILLKGQALTHHLTLGLEGAVNLNDTKMLTSFINVGYGISRQIGDNVHFFIEPTWSYALMSQSDANALLLVKPNKIGFNLGMTIKL